MEHAGFEEKQFESGLQHELAASLPWCFPSGPVLEAVLGYDFAVDPGKRSIWNILGKSCPPGLLLTPGLWQAGHQPPPDRLPSRSISLVIQAKRPVKLDHWRAGQHHYWHGPYFRFPLDGDQQMILAHLEHRASPQALVRYASPAFVGYANLQRHQTDRTLAEHSSFVSPFLLQGHRVWTYAGPGIVGYANPDGDETSADTLNTLLAQASEIVERQSVAQHILKLGVIANEVRAALRYEVGLSRRPLSEQEIEASGIPSEARSVVQAWVDVAYVTAWAGASWMLLGFE